MTEHATPRQRWTHVETWVFDLDNTLYEPSARLFDQIDARMTAFIMRELGVPRAEADRLRRTYWQSYGTTLMGLAERHGVDPVCFLADVHAIDLSALRPDVALCEAIRRLRGVKIVHTNGARAHAARVIAACGLDGLFDAVYAIEDKNFVPKPQAEAYRHIIRHAGLDPAAAAMIDDDARNLEVPKALGMATVWISHDAAAAAPAWIDRRITTLSGFLQEIGQLRD